MHVPRGEQNACVLRGGGSSRSALQGPTGCQGGISPGPARWTAPLRGLTGEPGSAQPGPHGSSCQPLGASACPAPGRGRTDCYPDEAETPSPPCPPRKTEGGVRFYFLLLSLQASKHLTNICCQNEWREGAGGRARGTQEGWEGGGGDWFWELSGHLS